MTLTKMLERGRLLEFIEMDRPMDSILKERMALTDDEFLISRFRNNWNFNWNYEVLYNGIYLCSIHLGRCTKEAMLNSLNFIDRIYEINALLARKEG